MTTIEESHNKARLEIQCIQEMLTRATDAHTRYKLNTKMKAAKANAHNLLLQLHAERKSARLAAEAETKTDAKPDMRRLFNQVAYDTLPASLHQAIKSEVASRANGNPPRRVSFWKALFFGAKVIKPAS